MAVAWIAAASLSTPNPMQLEGASFSLLTLLRNASSTVSNGCGQHHVNADASSTSASTHQRGCGRSQFIEISDFLLEEYKRPMEDTEKELWDKRHS